MDVKNYNRNRKKPVRKKGLRIVAFLLLFIGVVLAVFRYYKFMSKSIYEESVSHLTVTTRWRQVKPGILDYRKILKRISGREMM